MPLLHRLRRAGGRHGWSGRSVTLPTEVRPALGLRAGERQLAIAVRDPAGYAVATTRALLLVDADLAPASRLDWAEVLSVSWDTAGRLDLVRADGTGLAVKLSEPGRVPEVVRERVMASIVVSRHVAIPAAAAHGSTVPVSAASTSAASRIDPAPRGARLVARRDPEQAGIRWQVVLDPGVDGSDPSVIEQLGAELDALRRDLGG